LKQITWTMAGFTSLYPPYSSLPDGRLYLPCVSCWQPLLDSRFHGNDREGAGTNACWGIGKTPYPASLKLAPTEGTRGCAEGRSPFAGGLGVSPNCVFSPHEWGTKGVEARDTQGWTSTTSPSCCKNRDCMLYIRRTAMRSEVHAVTDCDAGQQWGGNDIRVRQVS
jgi:hypothetical protein